MALKRPHQSLYQVVQEMPAISNLHGSRRTLRDGVSENASSISAHNLYARVLTKPRRHRFAAPVWKQIDDPALLEITEDGSISVALLPRPLINPSTLGAGEKDGMFHGLLRSEVAESVAAANHLDHLFGICKGARGSGLGVEVHFHESAMPSLSKNEGLMDAAQFRSRCALRCARIAGSLARGLPEQSVEIAPAKAADLSCQPHPGCKTALAAHA
jgi:hypothetical protein